MASKIKRIIESIPSGGVLLSSWLTAQGLPRPQQNNYVKSGWLVRISRGVYHVSTENPRFFPVLNTLASQSGFKYHLGAFTALDLKGYSHYGQLGKVKAHIFVSGKWPDCIDNMEFGVTPIKHNAKRYGDTGLTTVESDGVMLKISSPERAIFECLDLIPEYANPMDVFYLMEMLSALRPRLVEPLLQKASIKTRRLFLYMAEKAGYPWFDELNLEYLNLGSGDRSVTPGGVYDPKYRIVIPKELASHE